jgi:hypothetical protein
VPNWEKAWAHQLGQKCKHDSRHKENNEKIQKKAYFTGGFNPSSSRLSRTRSSWPSHRLISQKPSPHEKGQVVFLGGSHEAHEWLDVATQNVELELIFSEKSHVSSQFLFMVFCWEILGLFMVKLEG